MNRVRLLSTFRVLFVSSILVWLVNGEAGGYLRVPGWFPTPGLRQSYDLNSFIQREEWREEMEELHAYVQQAKKTPLPSERTTSDAENALYAKRPECKGWISLEVKPAEFKLDRAYIRTLRVIENARENVWRKDLNVEEIIVDVDALRELLRREIDANAMVPSGLQNKVYYHSAVYSFFTKNVKRSVKFLSKIEHDDELDPYVASLLDFMLRDESTLLFVADEVINNRLVHPVVFSSLSKAFYDRTNMERDIPIHRPKLPFDLLPSSVSDMISLRIRCRLDLEETLKKYKAKLEATLKELEEYSAELEKELHLHILIDRKSTNPEEFSHSILAFAFVKFGHLPGLRCIDDETNDVDGMRCDVTDFDSFKEAHQEKMTAHIKEVEAQAADRSNALLYHERRLQRERDAFTANKRFLEDREPFVGLTMDEPPFQPQFARSDNPQPSTFDFVEFCLKRRPHFSPPVGHFNVFIHPDSRGYSVNDLLNKYLDLTPDRLPPLPWSEPLCGPINADNISDVTLLQQVQSLKAMWSNSSLFSADGASSELWNKLERLIGHRKDNSFLIGDFGQRIVLLDKFNIGPKWLRTELAILYFRALGRFRNALECVVQNLKDGEVEDLPHSDMTLVQLAAMFLSSTLPDVSSDANVLLQAALLNPSFEHPLTHYLLALSLNENTKRLKHLWRSFQLDPSFGPTVDLLYHHVCRPPSPNRTLSRPLVNKMCCWSTEQDVFCFGDPKKEKSCFKIDDQGPPSRWKWAQCFAPPPVALFITGFLFPSSQIRNAKITQTVDQLLRGGRRKRTRISEEVVPLDYGSDKQLYAKRKSTANADKRDMVFEYVNPVLQRDQTTEKKVGTDAASIDRASWQEVVTFDMDLPEILPVPDSSLRRKGQQIFDSLSIIPLESSACSSGREAQLLAPFSTDMLITAKGVDLSALNKLEVTPDTTLEPICPPSSSTSIALFDQMAAFKLQSHFKYYKPEKALRDPLLSITQGRDTVQELATRLGLAMKTAQANGDLWKVSTVAALYWRVQGDASNAINCLAYALKHSPNEYRDVAATALANIYHQAGFLHSALHAAEYALKNSATSEVSVHLTLANIFASLRDYDHALHFYHSTLALQSNFVLARERIRILQCIKTRR